MLVINFISNIDIIKLIGWETLNLKYPIITYQTIILTISSSLSWTRIYLGKNL